MTELTAIDSRKVAFFCNLELCDCSNLPFFSIFAVHFTFYILLSVSDPYLLCFPFDLVLSVGLSSSSQTAPQGTSASVKNRYQLQIHLDNSIQSQFTCVLSRQKYLINN